MAIFTQPAEFWDTNNDGRDQPSSSFCLWSNHQYDYVFEINDLGADIMIFVLSFVGVEAK